MTEQIGFLYKAAASLHKTENNPSLTVLRSFYLMRCKDLTKGYKLPEKHFSSKVRCSRCSIEWRKGTQTKVKELKLSKKQRRRIRSLKLRKNNKVYVEKRQELLNSKQVEQICTFCKQSTVTLVPKPERTKESTSVHKEIGKKLQSKEKLSIKPTVSTVTKIDSSKAKATKNTNKIEKKTEVNVYNVTKQAFSLNNNKNTLPSMKKEEQKVIKNNKKKKDKFAGLCQKAVLASAKLKEAKEKQNKLNLFLKPSS